ncbi:MAG TPA: ParA family protein [Trebonia sp.]|jgi:cellulose biosynthesis protein BcsQ|nr:ParA family protein [Trebonia sp.]
MRIYATYNIKGGVGKTTTAVNLAFLAAESGLRTVIWDLDPQGAASFMFRVKPKVKGGGKALIKGKRPLDDAIKGTDFDNLDLIPADFTYRNMDLLLDAAGGSSSGSSDAPGGKPARKLSKLLAPLADEYDAVFLDCPPSVSLVSENVLHAADVIVVPLIPTTLSVRTLEQLAGFVAEFNGHRPELLAFFSMVDRRKKLHREITEKLSVERTEVARTVIPALSVIETMSVERAPVAVFAPNTAATKAYRGLWAELRAFGAESTP